MSAFLIGRDEISASDGGGDSGIVVTSPVFANAVPRPDGQSEPLARIRIVRKSDSSFATVGPDARWTDGQGLY